MSAKAAPINPDENAFVEFAKFAIAQDAQIAPLIFKIPNDGLLAWAAFAALEKSYPSAFLLESADMSEYGRYSCMGASPRRIFRFANGVFNICHHNGEVIEQAACQDPLAALQEHAILRCAPIGEGLPPFIGGVVGYMGYDCAHYFEPIGEYKPDLLNAPDMVWMQTDWLVVFDHYRHELYVVKSCYTQDVDNDWRQCYQNGRAQALKLLAQMSSAAAPILQMPSAAAASSLAITSNMTREQFCDTVQVFKKHIHAGDIFQGVLSQRFSFAQPAPPLDIYRCLRRTNPSPYMFYLKCHDFVVAGSSPELMVSCRKRRVHLRPIAGTRPRGETTAADLALETELLADEKEIAEHLMLVDLGRNDVGRVAQAGTVKVSRFCKVERYSHVMHIVSAIEGQLDDARAPFDALRAAFPAGTLSGAPKVRAMQLINDYEPCRRNLYGGCAGYIGFDGDMMTCIMIRSFVAKEGYCYAQAGGGIVADSQPDKEYAESQAKARAVLHAAAVAAQEYKGVV